MNNNNNGDLKEYYSLLSEDPEGKNRACIRIERGPFAGITIALGNFKLIDADGEEIVEESGEETEMTSLSASYEYDMIGIPPDLLGKTFTDEDGEQLEQMLGEIFIQILNEALDEYMTEQEGENGTKIRTYDFSKPVVQ